MIIVLDDIIFKFRYEECDKANFPHNYKDYNCEICDMELCPSYSSLMTLLEEANLLPKDYKHLCCMCYFLDKVGLIDLEDHLVTWSKDIDDTIVLDFLIKHTNRTFDELYIVRIHDYEKFLFS